MRPHLPSGGARPPSNPAVHSGQQIIANSRQQSSEARGTLEMKQKILKVRRGREERRNIREEIWKVILQVSKLEEQKKLMDMVKQQSDASFTIETSVYKVR